MMTILMQQRSHTQLLLLPLFTSTDSKTDTTENVESYHDIIQVLLKSRRRRRPLKVTSTSTLSQLVSVHQSMLELCFFGNDNANFGRNDDISRIPDSEWNIMNEEETTSSNNLNDVTAKSKKFGLAKAILT
jgi:hypothetical protein